MSPFPADPNRVCNGAVDARQQGLTSAEARERLARFGPNVLPSEPPPRLAAIVVGQLKSPLIYVLLAAAAVALAMGDFTDAAFIGVVLLVNSALGAWQEWRAEQQSRSLQQLLRIRATVVRDGAAVEIDAEQLVPGDVVWLESGQRVPADLCLLEAHGLEIDEALLTGESVPVTKDPHWHAPADVPPLERKDRAFAGSVVVRGRAEGEVVATGAATVVGGLAVTMSTTRGGPGTTGRANGAVRAGHRHRRAGRCRRHRPAWSGAARRKHREHVPVCGGAGGVGNPGGPPGGHHRNAGHRRTPHGGPPRDRTQPAGGGGTRQLHADRQRQDRARSPATNSRCANCALRTDGRSTSAEPATLRAARFACAADLLPNRATRES